MVTQDVLEQRRLQKLEKAGIKVLPAAVRYSRSGRTDMRAAAAVVSFALTNKKLCWCLFVVCFRLHCIYAGAVVWWHQSFYMKMTLMWFVERMIFIAGVLGGRRLKRLI